MDSTVALLIQMIGFPLFMFLVSLLCVYDYKRRMTDKPWNDKKEKKQSLFLQLLEIRGELFLWCQEEKKENCLWHRKFRRNKKEVKGLCFGRDPDP